MSLNAMYQAMVQALHPKYDPLSSPGLGGDAKLSVMSFPKSGEKEMSEHLLF